jgi:glycerol-3-phosphate acyltransferase PlsY
MDWIFQTDDSFSYVFLPFGLAVTLFAHSSQQALGWHGGKGVCPAFGVLVAQKNIALLE